MTSSIATPSNFPYSIIPDTVCEIITDYLGSFPEAQEALCLRISQESENLAKASSKIIEKIWRTFAESIIPENPVLQTWVRTYSLSFEPDLKTRFHVVQTLMQEYITSKCAPRQRAYSSKKDCLEAINEKFSKHPINLLKLQALAQEMDELVELDNLKKIGLGIVDELTETPFERYTIRASDSKEINTYFDRDAQVIENIEFLSFINMHIDSIPKTFLRIPLTNLTNLLLSSNKLTTLPNRFGLNCPNLQVFDVSDNYLQSLPDDFGTAWNLLKSLDLSNNEIQCLPDLFGSTWTKLEKISLQHNAFLTEKSLSFSQNWPHNVKISIDNWISSESEEEESSEKTASSPFKSGSASPGEEEKNSLSESEDHFPQENIRTPFSKLDDPSEQGAILDGWFSEEFLRDDDAGSQAANFKPAGANSMEEEKELEKLEEAPPPATSGAKRSLDPSITGLPDVYQNHKKAKID